MRILITTLFCAALFALPLHVAEAETIIGGSIGAGQSLAGKSDARLSSTVHALFDVGHGWALGGEVSGSIEGYEGGWGCGTIMGGGVVPAVAVTCLQPSLLAHFLAATQAAPSPGTRLRLDFGVGLGSIWLLPGGGGNDQARLVPSGVVRATYLVSLGHGLQSDWWLGLALEEHGVVYNGARVAATIGLVLEGR